MRRFVMSEVAVRGKKSILDLSLNAMVVLESRYLKKNSKGEPIEKPEDLFFRVARAVSEAEPIFRSDISKSELQEWEDVFYNLMVEKKFMPNSPTLMNAGREMGMLSACFVLPVEDSIDGIFKSIHNTAIIQKAGGGTGYDFSQLRPKGDFVSSSCGRTSGPLSFMKVFSEATMAIQQGAFRRGANMGMMRIDHPDIIDFIRCKEDLSMYTNFNISVAVTDGFMKTLKENPNAPHRVINPRSKETSHLQKEKGAAFWTVGEVFDLIAAHAWSTGEPGVIFIDRINETHPVSHLGKIEATNPCGEQPLLPYEACNLGSINLAAFVEEREGHKRFNWEAFRKAIQNSIRFLDNVVEINNYPIPEIRKICLGNRKIGLGIMGFADALFKLRIPYNSREGVSFGEDIAHFLFEESHKASEGLASERGVFPHYEGSSWEKKGLRQRNACSTTIAPTGTISIIAACSGGIEPIFSLGFIRQVLDGKKLLETNEEFKEALKERDLDPENIIEEVLRTGSIQNESSIPLEIT